MLFLGGIPASYRQVSFCLSASFSSEDFPQVLVYLSVIPEQIPHFLKNYPKLVSFLKTAQIPTWDESEGLTHSFQVTEINGLGDHHLQLGNLGADFFF